MEDAGRKKTWSHGTNLDLLGLIVWTVRSYSYIHFFIFLRCALNNQHASNGCILLQKQLHFKSFHQQGVFIFPFPRSDYSPTPKVSNSAIFPLKKVTETTIFFFVPAAGWTRSCWKPWSYGPIAMCRSFDNYKPGVTERSVGKNVGFVFFVKGGFFFPFRKEVKMLRLT